MPYLSFTPNLTRLVACPAGEHAGGTVREVLAAAFASAPQAGAYVLDEQGRLRRHMALFVNSEQVRDLDQPVGDRDEVFVMQNLSGG